MLVFKSRWKNVPTDAAFQCCGLIRLPTVGPVSTRDGRPWRPAAIKHHRRSLVHVPNVQPELRLSSCGFRFLPKWCVGVDAPVGLE